MRDGNGAADDQSDVESVDDLFAVPAFFAAADDVIGDAVVAAENGGGDETEEFFRFRAEGAWLIGLVIESEETFHAEMAAIEDFFVQVGASFLKVFEAVRHESSES
jgi:hypothetical protein